MLRNVAGLLSKSKVCKWYKTRKDGRDGVHDEHQSERPSTSKTEENILKIRDSVLENRRLSFRDVVDVTEISFGSAQSILKDHLGLSRISSGLVSKSPIIIRQRLLRDKRKLRIRPNWHRVTFLFSLGSKNHFVVTALI